MTRITVAYSVGCDVTIGHHYAGTGYQSRGELSAGFKWRVYLQSWNVHFVIPLLMARTSDCLNRSG